VKGPTDQAGGLLDDHELSEQARAYGEAVVAGESWPLSDVDLSKVGWATSTRAKRKNGYCTYEADGRCTVTVAEHVYERAGFDACEETIRHELVHAWQHQHAGDVAVLAGDRPTVEPDGGGVAIEPGHGPSFRAWVDPLDLVGRCSMPYEKRRTDFAYVFECPSCGEWWGRHRLCKSVRQAAHGREGSAGYCYCVDCESLVHLRAGDRYLDHADHDDDAIRAFADGGGEALPTTRATRLTPAARPAADD
jgi:predicted SprT family Zn-dependent metalloprotease